MDLTTGRGIRRELDVAACAASLPLTEGWIESALCGPALYQAAGRQMIHLIGFPYRCAKLIFEGLEQLAIQTWRHPLSDQPRVFQILISTVLLQLIIQTAQCIEPLFTGVIPLIPSFNQPRVDAADIYTQSSKQIKDLYGRFSLRKLTKPICFAQDQGVCWGSSHWFLALYHALEKRCPDPDQRVRAVARYFRSGAPKEAILLQAIASGEPRHALFNLPTIQNAVFGMEKMGTTLTKLKLRHTSSSAPTQNGSYLVRRGYAQPSHEMALINVSPKKSYTFEPNYGLAIHTGDDPLRSAAKALGVFQHQETLYSSVA